MATQEQLGEFHSTIGALEIGVACTIFLLGVLTMQSYYYYCRFCDDPPGVKWLVFVIWFLELTQTSTILHAVYEMTVTFFGDPSTLKHPPKSFILAQAFGAVSAALVQGYLAMRVYRVLKFSSVAIFCVILTLVRLVLGITITATAYHMPELEAYQRRIGWKLFVILHAVSLVNDVIVTGGLCFSLVRSKGKAYGKTTAVIDKLIVWTLQSGGITALCNLIIMIILLVKPFNFVWIGFCILDAKLYANAMMAILNSRAALRTELGVDNMPTASGVGTGPQTRTLDIKVSSVTQVVHDYEMHHVGSQKLSPIRHP
ncbi:hypothetical protein DL96DRAFT_821542 [Flagelloscypha sp. PMI_526]|nr:hypothetical protein DL96DRAFT_821542 [Flagelloscypha sp. PMI_526]